MSHLTRREAIAAAAAGGLAVAATPGLANEKPVKLLTAEEELGDSVEGTGQDPATKAAENLMDKMTGQWVMTGTVGKKTTTDDVDVDWVLKRQYIRIHEVSRNKAADGGIGYEAWVYLVWDAKKGEYAVLWLDNTAATNFAPEGIGHAKPDGDRIPIIIKDADGTAIHTTFAYDRAKDSWTWAIDNVDKSGKASPFARLTLTRKK